MTLLQQIWANIAKYLASQKPAPLPTPKPTTPIPVLTSTNKIYLEAKACLDKHITLDPSVPPDLGCAEAVSFVLKNAGVQNLPTNGYAGTHDLYIWLKNHSTQVTTPQAGDVIISPTGTSTINSPHGHTGIVALYGILSNDSDTGLFMEKYTLDTWNKYFHGVEGFPVYYFRFNL